MGENWCKCITLVVRGTSGAKPWLSLRIQPLSTSKDILLWSEETVAKLRAGDFANLDIDHLIEEVEALGISSQQEMLDRDFWLEE